MKTGNKINMWSGPRNVSTAVMYSFAQRSDTSVVDEPFYAHYLLQSGVDHPGRAEVLESQPANPATVIQNLQAISENQNLLFLKNMAHHMIKMGGELDTLITEFQHIFLIRDPADMLPSLDNELPNPTLQDTAYQRQRELFERVQSEGRTPVVIDSSELLKDPKFVLSTLCQQLGISFDDTMLSWEAGPIPEDGIWANYWYDSVHQSTGFKPYTPKHSDLPDRLIPLYRKCKTIYDKMFVHAIKVEDSN